MRHLPIFIVSMVFAACSCTSHREYKLEQVIIANRHNVRAPLQKNIDSMNQSVGNSSIWIEWPNRNGELTPRGGVLEKSFGEYFKQYFQDNNFTDCIQSPDNVYFAASPRQRTVKSAELFAEGLGLTVEVVNSGRTEGEDRCFLPLLNDSLAGFDTLKFQKEAKREMLEVLASKKEKLTEAYLLLEDLVDYSCSERAKEGKRPHLSPTDTCIRFLFYKNNKKEEPAAYGDLKAANCLSDALILQFYEGSNEDFTPLGLTENDTDKWRLLAEIKDCYSDILFSAPIVAVNVSHGFLDNMYKLMCSGKRLVVLCTHDTTFAALFVALQLEPFGIPAQNSIESVTPVGVNFVIEKYDCEGEKFAKLKLVYQTSDQIRNMAPLSPDNPPAIIELSLKGLTKADGYYRWKDLENRIQETLAAFAKTAKGEKPF